MAAGFSGVAEITDDRKSGFEQMAADLMETPGRGDGFEQ